MRPLDPEEQALWDKVTATIRPLSRVPLAKPDVPANPSLAGTPRVRGRVPAPRPSPVPPLRPQPASNTLDGSWDKRLARGAVIPDRTIDLHGHNLDRAWDAIDQGLDRAIRSGDRVILLITGHPPKGEPPVERGKIRAAVNDWLGASRHSARIAAVRSAHPRHGGRGSLYVILRRG